MTAKYFSRFDKFAILRPFRVDTEQVELLEPVERIQIDSINRSKIKKKEEVVNLMAKFSDSFNRFMLVIDISNRMSNNAKLFFDKEYLEKVVRPWMEIFLWYFEVGYYDDTEFYQVLIRIKDNFKLFNEVNILEFVEWYSKFAIAFIKSALFKLQTKLTKEIMKNKSRFKSKLSRFLGEDFKDQQTLSFGSLF